MQCEPHIVQFFNKVGLFPNKRNYEAFMFNYFNATAFMFYYFNATACGALLILDLGPRSWNMATTLSLMGDEFLSIIQFPKVSIFYYHKATTTLPFQNMGFSPFFKYPFIILFNCWMKNSLSIIQILSGTIHKQALYPSPQIALKTWKALSKLWTRLTFQKDKSKAVDKLKMM